MYGRRGGPGLGNAAQAALAYWNAQATAAATPQWPYTTTPAGRVVPLVQVVDVTTGEWGPFIPGGVAQAGLLSKNDAVAAIGQLQVAGAPSQYEYNGQYFTGLPANILWALVTDGAITNVSQVAQQIQQGQQQQAAAQRALLEEAALQRGYTPAEFGPLRTDELRNLLCTGSPFTPCQIDPTVAWVPPDPGTSPVARQQAQQTAQNVANNPTGPGTNVPAPTGFGLPSGPYPQQPAVQTVGYIDDLPDGGWEDGEVMTITAGGGPGGYGGAVPTLDELLEGEPAPVPVQRGATYWAPVGAAVLALLFARRKR